MARLLIEPQGIEIILLTHGRLPAWLLIEPQGIEMSILMIIKYEFSNF